MSALLIYTLVLIVALGVLLKASDWFVEGAEHIGLGLGVSPFIVGVTIVAFGTSLPELATSIAAVLSGNSSIVIGNVVGSNITNILVVLGLTTVIGRTIHLGHNIMDVDMPLLFISALLLYFFIQDLHISTVEIILFLVAMMAFLLGSFKGDHTESVEKGTMHWMDFVKVGGGGALVWLGAEYTIESIVVISTEIGVSPDIIALTAVAIGTSLPEIVVSLSAIKRGQSAMAVGNVLGSNIFNTYVVIGIPALFGTLEIPETFKTIFVPIMIGATAIFAFICQSGRITKWEGIALLVFYAFFLAEVVRLGVA
jgi:cation:H+ antiporter